MKKLILGALLAAASSVGCSSSSDSVVDVTWKFQHADGTSADTCPGNFTTTNIVSQSIDPVSHRGTGLTVVDKFDCLAGHGTITLPDDTFLVWVEITNDSGSSTFAQSEDHFVDASLGDDAFLVKIIDDGGYVALGWDLVDAQTGAALSCRDAGVGSGGSVEVTPTLAGSSALITDKFTCEDHFGTTDPLVAGRYTLSVAVNATNNAADPPLGDPTTVTNVDIGTNNEVTDIGNLMLPID